MPILDVATACGLAVAFGMVVFALRDVIEWAVRLAFFLRRNGLSLRSVQVRAFFDYEPIPAGSRYLFSAVARDGFMRHHYETPVDLSADPPAPPTPPTTPQRPPDPDGIIWH